MRLILRSLIVFFIVMLLYVGLRVNVMKLGYEIEDLKAEKKNLEQIHNSLLIERAALTSTERIEKIATSYLEMKRPDDSQIVLVTEGRDGKQGPTFAKTAKTNVAEKDTSSPLRVVKYFDWRL